MKQRRTFNALTPVVWVMDHIKQLLFVLGGIAITFGLFYVAGINGLLFLAIAGNMSAFVRLAPNLQDRGGEVSVLFVITALFTTLFAPSLVSKNPLQAVFFLALSWVMLAPAFIRWKGLGTRIRQKENTLRQQRNND